MSMAPGGTTTERMGELSPESIRILRADGQRMRDGFHGSRGAAPGYRRCRGIALAAQRRSEQVFRNRGLSTLPAALSGRASTRMNRLGVL